MSKFFLLTVFVLSGFSVVTFAQSNSPDQKGFVIMMNGDTLRGLINYVKERDLYRKIGFARSINAPVTIYGPWSIYGYYLEESNQLFLSKFFLAMRTETRNPDSLSVFLRAIVTGPGSLYQGQNRGQKDIYYGIGNGQFLKLDRGKTSRKEMDGVSYNKVEAPFQATLKKIFKDCPVDSARGFEEFNLVKAFEDYNRCKNETSINYSNYKPLLRVGFTIGMSSSSVSFVDENTETKPYGYPSLAYPGKYNLSSLTAEKMKDQSITWGMVFSLSTKNKHLSWEAQALATSRKYSSTSQKLEVKATYLEFPLYLKYNFSIEKRSQLFFIGGVNFALSVHSDFKSDNVDRTFYTTPLGPSTPLAPTITTASTAGGYTSSYPVSMPTILGDQFNPSQMRFLGGVGLDSYMKNKKRGDGARFTFLYRYEFNGSITNSDIYETKVSLSSFSAILTPYSRKKE